MLKVWWYFGTINTWWGFGLYFAWTAGNSWKCCSKYPLLMPPRWLQSVPTVPKIRQFVFCLKWSHTLVYCFVPISPRCHTIPVTLNKKVKTCNLVCIRHLLYKYLQKNINCLLVYSANILALGYNSSQDSFGRYIWWTMQAGINNKAMLFVIYQKSGWKNWWKSWFFHPHLTFLRVKMIKLDGLGEWPVLLQSLYPVSSK